MAAPTVRKLGEALGGEIAGLDLSRPIDGETFAGIESALDEHLVLVFRDQQLDAPALAAFGQRFGLPRPHALKAYRHPDHDDVSYIRNVDDEGNIDPFGNIRATTWHADATYESELPRLAILHAREIPSSGGGTFSPTCAPLTTPCRARHNSGSRNSSDCTVTPRGRRVAITRANSTTHRNIPSSDGPVCGDIHEQVGRSFL